MSEALRNTTLTAAAIGLNRPDVVPVAAKPAPVKAMNFAPRSIKVTIGLDADSLVGVEVATVPRVILKLQYGGRVFKADIAAKALRKAVAVVAEHGPGNVSLMLQGKLVGDEIQEAGLAAQLKTPKPETTS